MNRRRFMEFSGAAGLLAALAACGSSEPDDRRFANQPTPTLQSGGSIPPTKAPQKSTATSTTSMSHDALMQVRGDRSRVVLADAAVFWSIGSDGAGPVRFGAVPKHGFVDVDATRDGAKIGTIVSDVAGHDVVTIFGADGREIRHIAVKGAAVAPTASGDGATTVRGRLAWNAAGDKMLYAKSGGGIDAIGESGDPVALVSAKQAAHPGNAVWSPAGDAIAFVNRKKIDAGDGLYVGSTSTLPVDPASIVTPNAQSRAIPQVAWLPDGARVLFTQGSKNASDPLSGDLFQVMASGGAPALFISAGLAGPVSAIGIFEASPAGEAIAFTIWVPNGKEIAFHSLWVKPIAGGSAVRVDISSNASVNGIWWTDAGLVWREQIDTLDPAKIDGPFELHRLTLDGKGAAIFASKSMTPATPVASPVSVSPVAASPVAGSPVASPARS